MVPTMKTRTTEIYQLNPVLDDPRFEGFGLGDDPSVLGRESLADDLSARYGRSGREWERAKLGHIWPTPFVEGRVSEFNDFPCVNLMHPAFSERAVDALRDLLEPNGELLPLKTRLRTKFFLYNVLTISDALDRDHSQGVFLDSDPHRAIDIKYFAFDVKQIQSLSIFLIRELSSSVFVTNYFVERVNSSKLQGFAFKKAWPFPPGVNWRLQKPARKKGDDLKKETLVLVLKFGNTEEEISRIKGFEDLVDERLQIKSLESEYYGSYERHEINNNEYRMFFSCPKVDALLKYLLSDIKRLNWPTPIEAHCRYGGMFNWNVKQKLNLI
jgi:hypothetical protein